MLVGAVGIDLLKFLGDNQPWKLIWNPADCEYTQLGSLVQWMMLIHEWCSLDRHEMVLVTHIRDPCHFMIQRVADMEQLQIMMNVINIYCDSTENIHDLLYDVKIGMLVSSFLESVMIIAVI